MEIFNNREIAIAIWIGIAFAWTVSRRPTRKAMRAVFRALTHRLILINIGAMIAYVTLTVYILYYMDIWHISQLKDTLLWTVSVAMISLFRINEISNDQNYFKKNIKDIFKLLVILEFIVAFYVFPLWVEFIIVPVSTFLVAMQIYAEMKKEYASLAKIIGNIMAALGVCFLIYSIYMMIADFGSFAQMQTVSDFILPPLLTFLYLPFILVLSMYLNYEVVFIRLGLAVKESSLRKYAKRHAPLAFHIRTGLLKRWARNIMAMRPTTKAEIKESIKAVKRLHKRERNPDDVPLARGWSPYTATHFLAMEGFRTDDYHCALHGTDEWHAASRPVKVDRSALLSTITYYVQGNEYIANQLELVLDVYEPEIALQGREKFLSNARLLCKAALEATIPANIHRSLSNGVNCQAQLCGKQLVVSMEKWTNRRLNGFTMKFVIRNP